MVDDSGDSAKPLQGQAIIFAQGQFSPEDIAHFSERVLKLGGSIVQERPDAHILLVNPNTPAHAKEKSNLEYLRRSYPDVALPTVLPYHWLAHVETHNRMIEIEELRIASPIFTNPDRLKDFPETPLRAWVSVNLHREEGETPEQAQQTTMELLSTGGAIIVDKRAKADVLIVDEQSNFAKKVRDERAKNNRHHQRIVERDWVVNCLRNKTLLWRGIGKDMDDDDHQSMLDDDDDDENRDSKGPGRPTGKLRVEYSAQDDDFLCRYLAAYTGTQSLRSRKTYSIMTAMSDKYPHVARHSSQSWHERVKKNFTSFERRILRFIQQGVDETLKTKDEREKAKANTQINQGDARNGLLAGTATTETATAARGDSSSSAIGRAETPRGKRKLVESDSDSEDQTNAPAPAVLPSATVLTRTDDRHLIDPELAGRSASSALASTSAPAAAVSAKEPNQNSNQREQHDDAANATATALAAASTTISTIEEGTPAVNANPNSKPIQVVKPSDRAVDAEGDRTMDTDVVDGELLGIVDGAKAGTVLKAKVPGEESEGDEDIGETQAILGDFARIRAQAAITTGETALPPAPPQPSTAATTAPAATIALGPSPRRVVRIDETSLPRQPPATATATATVLAEPSTSTSTSMSVQDDRRSPSKRIRRSMPSLQENFGENPHSQRIRDSRISMPDTRATNAIQSQRVYGTQTPSPSKALASRHAMLREKLLNSSQKRRRTLDRAAAAAGADGGDGGGEVETVNQSTKFDSFAAPPPSLHKPRSSLAQHSPSSLHVERSPSPLAQSTKQRPAQRGEEEVLSPEERMDRVRKGQELIMRTKERYRSMIGNLALEFGKPPVEIMKFLNSNSTKLSAVAAAAGVRVGEDEYWANAKRALRKEFSR